MLPVIEASCRHDKDKITQEEANYCQDLKYSDQYSAATLLCY